MQAVGSEIQCLLADTLKSQDAIKKCLPALAQHADALNTSAISSLTSDLRRIRSLNDETATMLKEYLNGVLNPGLVEMPNEVLSFIFELACSPGSRGSDVIAISHVCRRFRRVALGFEKLWSRLHSTYPLSKTTTFLARTKSSGLIVVVDDDYCCNVKAHLEAFLSLVKPHCCRWIEFRYLPRSFPEELYNCTSYVEELRALTARLRLPRLHRLSIYSGRDEAEDLTGQDPTICNDWWAPELQYLSSVNGQPNVSLFKTVSSLTLELAGYDPHDIDDAQPCLSSLLTSLAALPYLHTLELTLISLVVDDGRCAVTELPSLRELYVFVGGSSESNTLLRNFSSALRLPSLLNLAIIVAPLCKGGEFQDMFDGFAFRPTQCPSLRALHIGHTGFIRIEEPILSFGFDSTFVSFPMVEQLSIDAVYVRIRYSMAKPPAHLVKCSLVCYDFPEEDLERLMRAICSSPGCEKFDQLVISGKPGVLSQSLPSTCGKLRETFCGKLAFDPSQLECPSWAEDFNAKFNS